MIFSVILPVALLASSFADAAPVRRAVAKLDAAATAEAHKFDATATRAFTKTTIKTSDGSCLAVDPLSGDFRSNLTPVTASKCDGSKNQEWDVATKGVHNNVEGQALFINALTNACLNFDPRRQKGNQVLLFSCGGRADGDGKVTDSQLFEFDATTASKPFALTPLNGKGEVCLTVTGGLLDQSPCKGAASATGAQLFTIGDGKAAATTTTAATDVKAAVPAAAQPAAAAAPAAAPVVRIASKKVSAKGAAPDGKIAVARAGGVLNPAAAAEANPFDATAVRAFTKKPIKTNDGGCLSIDPNAGDFRQNLIPIAVKKCDATDPGQLFDVIKEGKHNQTPGQVLFVSALTNGCVNFDPRRAQDDQVILFSCGGRADGEGKVVNSQQFAFTDGKAPFPLTPLSSDRKVCLSGSLATGKLGSKPCDADNASGDELFSIA